MDPSIALFTQVLRGTIRRMTTLAFDTHKAVKALKEAGFDDSKAEAVVATVGDAIGGSIATKADIAELHATTKADITELRIATKADIAELRAEMKADIAELRAEMKADIAELRAEMYRLVLTAAVSIIGLTTGLTVALVKLLP